MKFKVRHLIFKFVVYAFLIHISWSVPMAQNKPCPFDEKTLQFAGDPVEQALCLLRPNQIGGRLANQLPKLPAPLANLIGRKVEITKADFRRFLQKQKISEASLGGSLDQSLSTAQLPDGTEIQALYFIIHDTSFPYLKDEAFPENFETDPGWKGNDLSIWLKQPVAHIFVNRLGDSLAVTPLSEPVGKGWGTKFARDFLKAGAKGLQLHIELVQPRRRDGKNPNLNNDLIAPVPGFTDRQYQRLALLYIAAGLRRGTWLIPAYHSAIDAGIRDAHDDPQNFVLENFAASLKNLLKKLK